MSRSSPPPQLGGDLAGSLLFDPSRSIPPTVSVPRRLACTDQSTGSLCPLVGFWLSSISGRSWQDLEAGGQDQSVPRPKATAPGSGPSYTCPLCRLGNHSLLVLQA